MKKQLLVSALALLAALPLRAASVAELAGAYDNLTLGKGATTVVNMPLTQGNMRLQLSSGSVTPVMAGEEQVGMFFFGSGTFSYTSVESLEHLVLTHNVKKATNLTAEKNGRNVTITGSFDRLFWRASGVEMPKVGGSAAEVPAAEFAKHREMFLSDFNNAPDHPFLQHKLDKLSSPLVRAEIWGRERLVYLYDADARKSEWLRALNNYPSDNPEIKKIILTSTLSDQPIARDLRDPVEPPFLLTHLDFTLVAEGERQASLEITETLVPQGRPRKTLRFDLNSYVYDNRLQHRLYNLRGVTDAAGNELSFDHRNEMLIVELPAVVQPGKPLQLKFEIDGDFLIRPQGDNFWQLGVDSWFPQPNLGGQYYTIHSLVKVKGDFVPFAPGKTVQRKSENGWNIVENVVDKPVQFAVVHAGKYKVSEETRDGLTVRIATYAMKNDTATKRLTGLAFDAIKFYDFTLGAFPFSEFNIIEVPQFGWGQAPPATMFITHELFDRYNTSGYEFTEAEVNSRFAHEIAHQYWGHVVKMPSFEEQWITEAFADYSAALFIETAYGKRGKGEMNRIRSQWKGNAAFAKNSSSIMLANRISTPGEPPIGYSHRQWLLYGKGPLLLDALRKELGDDQFLTFMKSYQRSFAWKFGTTKHMAGLLQFMTKKDYMPFFEQYYWGSDTPK